MKITLTIVAFLIVAYFSIIKPLKKVALAYIRRILIAETKINYLLTALAFDEKTKQAEVKRLSSINWEKDIDEEFDLDTSTTTK